MTAVIGAGPAGSFAAYKLAKAGYIVDLYEDNAKIGEPVQCTGICTSSLKDLVNIQDVVMNEITYAKIVAPNQESVTIKMDKANVILSRSGFDKKIGNMAHDAGANIHLSHRFQHGTRKVLQFKHKGELIEKSRKTNEVVIGSDGPNTTVGKAFDMVSKHTVMYGAQASVRLDDIPENTLEFYPVPNGYKWVVPEGEGIARVGLAVYHQPNVYFKQFIKDRCPTNSIVEYQGGIIPKYSPRLQTEKNNVFLLGDAAAHVKWTTGGGIIQGLIAAKAASAAIETNQSYHSLWKKDLRKDLWLHLRIRNLMDKFSNKDYNKLIQLSNQDKIKNILRTHDRDFIAQFLATALVHEPRYLLFLKNLFKVPSWKNQPT